MRGYRIIGSQQVPTRTLTSARRAAAQAARLLGVRARLRWIAPTDTNTADVRHGADVLGLAKRSGDVFLRADLAPRYAAEVAAHEVRHVWQWAVGAALTDADAEFDADAFARRLLSGRYR